MKFGRIVLSKYRSKRRCNASSLSKAIFSASYFFADLSGTTYFDLIVGRSMGAIAPTPVSVRLAGRRHGLDTGVMANPLRSAQPDFETALYAIRLPEASCDGYFSAPLSLN